MDSTHETIGPRMVDMTANIFKSRLSSSYYCGITVGAGAMGGAFTFLSSSHLMIGGEVLLASIQLGCLSILTYFGVRAFLQRRDDARSNKSLKDLERLYDTGVYAGISRAAREICSGGSKGEVPHFSFSSGGDVGREITERENEGPSDKNA